MTKRDAPVFFWQLGILVSRGILTRTCEADYKKKVTILVLDAAYVLR